MSSIFLGFAIVMDLKLPLTCSLETRR